MYFTVYKTINTIDGKFYIGKHVTDDPNDSYLGSGKRLRAAIRKHGRGSFYKEVLFVFDNEQAMNLKEAELVDERLCEEHNCYNIMPGGNGGFRYINENGLHKPIKTHSAETRKKLSAALKGRKHTAETRAKLSAIVQKRVYSEEAKAAIDAGRRKPKTAECKAKIRAAVKAAHERLSEQERVALRSRRVAAMAEARAAKPEGMSDATRQKIREKAFKQWETRKRRVIPWQDIQSDFDRGMARHELLEKYEITRDHLLTGRRSGLFTGSYKKIARDKGFVYK